jgi:hypothetical protein
MGMVFIDRYRIYISGIKGRSPSNGKLTDFSFYIDSQKSAHRKFKDQLIIQKRKRNLFQ